MDNKKNIPWWLVISMLVFFWPVGLVLMFIKIFGENDGRRPARYRKGGYRVGEDYIDVPYKSSDGEIGAKVPPRERGGKAREKMPGMPSLTQGKILRGLGVALTFGGGLASAITFLGNLLGGEGLFYAAAVSSIVFLCIGVPGLALTFWGQSVLGKAQRFSRYARLIGDSPEVSLDRLAGAMGIRFEKVCDDLQKMLDGGFFAGYYVDHERRVLTRDRLSGAARTAPKAEEKKEPKAGQVHPADRIRAINDAIRQPEVSQKIDRLESLTRRIYHYTDTYPEKEQLARSFKERYLPKTIKILEAYSRFERSGSSGENVRAAMQDVEAVLDVLLQSFEKQLDMLYMDEALDVSTDIDVLERMISGDGLGQSPFALRQEEM